MKRSPLRRIGGKHYQAKFIIKQFVDHRIYAEPFAGAAAVFFRKENLTGKVPGYREVLNDLDGEIYTFFKVLRERPQELVDKLKATPYARRSAQSKNWPKKTELDRAVALAVSLYQCFAGRPGASWGFSKQGCSHPNVWKNLPEKLIQAAERILDVYLESSDFERCIRTWDTEQTLFFCDPPYVGHEDCYQVSFDHEDHLRLARTLRSIKGRALVTYYDHRLVRKLYRGWRILERSVSVPSRKVASGQKRPRRIELYLMNYGIRGKKLKGASDK